MVALSDSQFIGPEDYLELEANSLEKHEYVDGEIYAMTGTTDGHNQIAGNLYISIRSHLRGSRCRVYMADVKVQIEKRNRFYYPDLMVTCDDRDRETSLHKSFPKLIIEILSPSTEARDRGRKFSDYITLESLEEYVLVNPKEQKIEIFRPSAQGGWHFQEYYPEGKTFPLQSLDLDLAFTDVYEDIEFTDKINKA
ncbi:Uma2 family endonuclease [Roseofilum casamattae]|uniref:Uma2 family endonuclease n=1 Tax=Roseofilum casamattae BLCC-M143 TaxID=3022442 RepID=A0ABT7C2A3_9CYAN|nr:Uma2 family endonuclease [Roseofilum casamattae]MDJ1184806.1 Uma2 family endonuclease [Roseofilum casamattae BLCC-M143]